jgi:transposase
MYDRMTHAAFVEMFPTDDACRDYLKERFYPAGTACPACGRPSRFHRITGRSAYSCQFCGTHVYPTSETIFHRSTTSLRLWFWAIFLISSTHCEITPRQLERELGVSNKTARRMFAEIRGRLVSEDPESADAPRPFQFARAKVSLPTRGVWDGRARRSG